MKDVDVEEIHQGERIPTLEAIGEQARELEVVRGSVTCPCGNSYKVTLMHQCYYCDVWFCKSCADDHFEENKT